MTSQPDDSTDWTWGRAAQVLSVVLAMMAIIWSVAGRDHNIQAFPKQIAENAAAAKDAKMAAEASAKEANANDTNLANRLTSPQRIMIERGDDPDEIAAEIKAWEAEFGPLGGNAIPEPPEEGEDATDDETPNRHRRAHLVRVRAYA